MSARQHHTRSLWRLLLPLSVLLLYVSGGCSELGQRLKYWADRTFGEATPRDTYRWSRPFDKITLARWDSAYQRALDDTLRVDLPHQEVFGADTAMRFSAHSLNLRLPPGRRLTVQAEGTPPFGELFEVTPDGERERVAYWDTLSAYLSYEGHGPGPADLLLIVQSRPYPAGPYTLTLVSEPALLFPVAGRNAGSIGSFWGDRRDGGRRRHEGNDIFAPRGTPLLAVADGRVARVQNGGLGGKTVWLRDRERRLNYYYAHLDSQFVYRGQAVARGDTIGWVGNTGNARTTPPHLHFGIYANGARDPLPYLRAADGAPEAPAAQPGTVIQVPERGRHYLRVTPEREGTVIRQLLGGERIRDLATTGRYHRVATAAGETGYVNFD
ncbi:M23 family metallopeptidase [Neolewinella litorea]|uniref:M23 family metallopeptidase n=1 Tax=Neolewinella litorea TaxID=2562452 RepID=A0A4S4NA86_9BACT|nr:M23 family metallopeptidase [Neolewinella litorea]THH34901.1 M23 family metallopeptidase [Neolewinella litorea]